ncbi:MAG: winged helix-turn-helix transcriptional regulator [Candidatus Hodarchaeales archaeon]
MISNEDYKIINILEIDPLMSYSDLAEKLGVSWPTAKNRVQTLKSRGIIRTPVAIYNIEALGLHRITVIWSVENLEKLVKLEKLCDIHPYTHYRSRGYGQGFFLLAQFDVPEEVVPLMYELNSGLKKLGYCTDSNILESSGLKIETFSDLEFFDPHSNKWHFDWESWVKEVNKASTKISRSSKAKEVDLKIFDEMDFNILREITKNPAIKQAELMRKFSLSRTETHRRYNAVFGKLISCVRLRYDRILFNLVNTKLFWVSQASQEKTYKLYNTFKNIPPPFRLGMDILKEKGFLLWGGGLPTYQEQQLAFALWLLFPKYQVITLDTSIASTAIYWFYPQNFDFSQYHWKTSREWVIDEPLKELLENG